MIKKRKRDDSNFNNSESKRMKFRSDIDEDDLRVKLLLLINKHQFQILFNICLIKESK